MLGGVGGRGQGGPGGREGGRGGEAGGGGRGVGFELLGIIRTQPSTSFRPSIPHASLGARCIEFEVNREELTCVFELTQHAEAVKALLEGVLP